MSTKIYDPKKDIINTLSYKKIFAQPMTFYQLIYFCHFKFESLSEIENHLKELIERSKVKYKDGLYFLGSSKSKKEDIKNSKIRQGHTVQTIEKLNQLKHIFEQIPFIKYVGVTGTLASYNFDFENDDIDLFFICSKNRLWLSRFFVVILLKILNIYVNNNNPKLKICPNLYISEENMLWKEDKRSLYVAHEIAMMQPLVDKDATYLKFLSVNKWLNTFLPNVEINDVSELISKNNKETTFLDILDYIIMVTQKFFMKVRFGSEILERNIIHFIKNDHSISVLESYDKIKN
jgi:hypothetical protein